jgi:hypothetical protein
MIIIKKNSDFYHFEQRKKQVLFVKLNLYKVLEFLVLLYNDFYMQILEQV